MTSLSALPESIDGYRVEGLLGRGASGLVLRVHDEALDRSLALKLLSDDVDAEAKGRFLIEARAAARIAHPNVVQVYSVGEHAGRAYITQELVEGFPLSSLLELRGRISPAAVIDIGLQVAEGLRQAAEVGVLHRDVKPHNLLVTDEGTVKLADFGVAKLMDAPSALTDDGTTVGTPHYMSPEQGQGRSLDARSDQYSLGATLYHLLSGQPPFDADNVLSLLLKHVQEPLPPLLALAPDCPPNLASIVERMLAKAPSARYADFGELIAALQATQSPSDPAGEVPEVLALVEAAAQGGKPRLPTEALPVPPAPGVKRGTIDRLVLIAAVVVAVAVVVATWVDRVSERPVTGTAAAVPGPVLVAVPEPELPPPAAPVEAPPPEPAPPPKRVSNPKVMTLAELSRDLERDQGSAERAARELGRRGDQGATLALIKAVEHGPTKVAVAAAWALGELNDVRAVEPLRGAKDNARAQEVQQAAGLALQKLWHVEEE